MILNHVKLAGTDQPINIRVEDDKITEVSAVALTGNDQTVQLTFNNATVFPGLINSHDHLDFNLFPQFGGRTYSNYTDWGAYIHENYKAEIAAVLKIPVLLRSEWGVYKNLLCGVTTVVNHGEPSGLNNPSITVFEETHVLHSVQFEKSWKRKLNDPFKAKLPVSIHIGEGIDWPACHEIDQLIRWNLLRKRLVGVHAVAMLEDQARKFEAIVWCPHSNYFLLNKTAPVNVLKKHTNILFGTDSTLTSTWDIWEHVRLARKTGLLNDAELYQTLNQNAAKTWHLNSGEIAAGKDADIVVARAKKSATGFNSFFGIKPADLLLVMHKGVIRLFDEAFLAQLSGVDKINYSSIGIDGAVKYVWGDLPGLMEKISGYYPEAKFSIYKTETAQL